MSDLVLVGPFWTRDEAASYLGITGAQLLARTDLVRLNGRWLEETYPAFQFRDNEVRYEVATIVAAVGTELPGPAIADWLCRVNALLGGISPLDWFNTASDIQAPLTAIHADMEDVLRRAEIPTAKAV